MASYIKASEYGSRHARQPPCARDNPQGPHPQVTKSADSSFADSYSSTSYGLSKPLESPDSTLSNFIGGTSNGGLVPTSTDDAKFRHRASKDNWAWLEDSVQEPRGYLPDVYWWLEKNLRYRGVDKIPPPPGLPNPWTNGTFTVPPGMNNMFDGPPATPREYGK